MSVKNATLSHFSTRLPMDQAVNPESCAGVPWSDAQRRDRVCHAVVHLIVKLERAMRAELPIADRLLLLRELKPKVVELIARLPKSVVINRRFGAAGEAGQTLEQRLCCLMAKNFKLALDELGRSGLVYAETSAKLRPWLVRNLFRFIGRQVEYAVRWDRPYAPGIWGTLHELYFDLGARRDLLPEFAVSRDGDAFDPEIEYKRLLLLGLVGKCVAPADRSDRLIDATTSMARESRLEQPASYSGTFGFFVVELALDGPPKVSGALDYGFHGWVFLPTQEFLDLVGGNGT